MKKTLVALAVASIVSVPMTASAEGSIYASARYGFENKDGTTAEAVSHFRNFGSRFGMKADTDLGNGTTAYSLWEIQMFGGSLRDFKVGVKGGFGDIYMGNGINHAWDSVLTTDNTWWYGGSMHLTEGVQSNAITYQGGSGAFSFGATVRMADGAQAGDDNHEDGGGGADEEAINQTELVAAFDVAGITIGLGITDEVDDFNVDPEPVTGLVVSGAAGSFNWAFDYQMQSDSGITGGDMNSIQLEGGFGPFIAQYGMKSDDSSVGGTDKTALVLSYTKDLGPDTLMYFEYRTTDLDTAGTDDPTNLAVVLKHNLF